MREHRRTGWRTRCQEEAYLNRFAILLTAALVAGCGEQPAENVSYSPSVITKEEPGNKTPRHGDEPKPAARSPRLVPATYFVDAANNGRDIEVIRRNTDPEADIAGRYSKAMVSCGTGCTAFWIIDRRTGAILQVPESSNAGDSVDDIQGRKDSDLVRVIYSSSDNSGATCRAQDFRLTGTVFVKLGELAPLACSSQSGG